MKRKPKIYLSGSIDNYMVRWWKDTIIKFDYSIYPVEFLNPARHKLNSIIDNELIATVNTNDIHICDAMCVYFPGIITAGTSIELFLAVSILGKPTMVFTDVQRADITPYVRNLCAHRIYLPSLSVQTIERWLKKWYESA